MDSAFVTLSDSFTILVVFEHLFDPSSTFHAHPRTLPLIYNKQ
jgi:hypothetical protein